jgi:hypothetical protein
MYAVAHSNELFALRSSERLLHTTKGGIPLPVEIQEQEQIRPACCKQ